MLQMVIMFIMAGVVVATGLVAVSQATVQSRMQETRTINQRLDAAALAVEQTLRRYPGMAEVGPVQAELESNGVPVLPASIGTIRETPWGTKFRYCPLSLHDNSATITANATQVIRMNGDSASVNNSYNAASYNGTVVSDTVGTAANTWGIPSFKSLNAVALITAPAKPGDLPPNCNSAVFNGNRLVVPNGFVRMVTLSRHGGVANSGSAKSAIYYVSQTGGGDMTGRDQSNTAQIDAAIADIYAKRPNEIFIGIVGTVTPTRDSWMNLTYNMGWGHKIKLSGGTLNLPRNQANGPNTTFEVLGRWELDSVILNDARAYVHPQSELHLTSSGTWYLPQDGINYVPAITVEQGGKLSFYGSTVTFGAATNGTIAAIENRGEVRMVASYPTFFAISGTGARFDYYLINTGRLFMDSSNINANSSNVGARTLRDGLIMNGAKSTVVVNNSGGASHVFGGQNGACWYDSSGSDTIVHARTRAKNNPFEIPPESEFAESNQPYASQTATYRTNAARRNLARANMVTSLATSGRLNCL